VAAAQIESASGIGLGNRSSLGYSGNAMKTVDRLFEETGLTIDDVSERAKLPIDRVEAIACGRWTPSPSERGGIAAAFGVELADISWGHSMDPRNIRYRRYGFKDKSD